MPYANINKRREYQRKWMAKRRADWFAANGPCSMCGSWENLELDHIEPSSKIDHKVWSWSNERRAAELAKCRALCDVCHLIKSKAEKLRGLGVTISVLKESQVNEARREFRAGNSTFAELGNKYGVRADTIRKAVRSGWAHVEEPEVPL